MYLSSNRPAKLLWFKNDRACDQGRKATNTPINASSGEPLKWCKTHASQFFLITLIVIETKNIKMLFSASVSCWTNSRMLRRLIVQVVWLLWVLWIFQFTCFRPCEGHIRNLSYWRLHVMMLLHGNAFHINGPRWGESTRYLWISSQNISNVELWCFMFC